MPRITVNGCDLFYEDVGSGPETIVFAHGLLWSGRMFAEQMKALSNRYRCVAFDFRGQGQSEVTRTGYDMDTLADDAAQLIERLGLGPCHFLGLSMGGFVGMRLAARRPELLKSLMLLETTADPEPTENVPRYRLLSFIARWLSMRLVGGKVMAIMFGRKFLTDPARAKEREVWAQSLLANNKAGTSRATEGVITRKPVHDEIPGIRLPTLIVCGDQDVATPPAKSERIQSLIPNSRLVIIPGAGHSSSIEEPAAVTAAILEFLETLPLAKSVEGVNRLFVYGTLRAALKHPMHRVLVDHATYLGEGRIRAQLYDLGRYPGVWQSAASEDSVVGELYVLGPGQTAESLRELDKYEKCAPEDPEPHEYERKLMRVRLRDGAEVDAWVYVLRTLPPEAVRIPSGDYVAWCEDPRPK
jgi:pimeloyl-ACP methyl ester carboxylesterase/gamma-glutamylcyclotransferase (GGCT)/AIG2-like uncharacterized protein YtfP